MVAALVLRLIAKDATSPVTKEIATRMADPDQFAALLSRPAAHPARKAVDDVLVKAAILSNLIKKHQAEQAPAEDGDPQR